MRDSIIFYRSFVDSFAELPDEDRLIMYDAVFKYGLDGEEPKLNGVQAALFKLVKPQIDANERRYQNGLKGGRKPNVNQNVTKRKPNCNQSETKVKPNHNQTETKTEPNVTKPKPNVNVNDNYNGNGNGNASGSDEISSLLLYLNEETGSNYSETEQIRELIGSKLDEGYTAEDIRTVIHNKNLEWNCSGKMRTYLRPSTLFGDKFEEYLNGPVSGEVNADMEKESKAERLRSELDDNLHLLEQKQNRMDEIESEGVNDQNRNEIETLRFEVAHLEDVIQNLNRRLNKNETG